MADIKEILSNMTTDEKIGQLLQHNAMFFSNSSAEITGPLEKMCIDEKVLETYGSVLNFSSARETVEIQKKHLEKNKIPMLFMMDVIHGFRTIYPIPLALGCSFDPKLVENCSKMAAKEASAGGVHVTFTPMVDYVRDARWGRVMETCGEDVLLNCEMGRAQVRGFQGDDLTKNENLATCVKHFAAYGGAEAGRDYTAVELSEHSLREFYLPAYKACIDEGTTMLMPSFNTLNGVPAVANSWLMKDILMGEWGFDGVVISDYNAVCELMTHGVAENKKECAKLAFDNNCHIEMCSTAYANHLKELIDEGVFTEEQLDNAVFKVLDLKNKLGLFENPYRGVCEDESKVFLTEENRLISRKAAEECAVLLKNDGVLPLSENIKNIALIGPMADNHEIIGFWSCNGRNEESVTVKDGVSKLLPDAKITVVKGCSALWDDLCEDGFAEAITAAKNADAVILCLGEPQNYSGEGNSRTDLKLPGVQEKLALEVAKYNKNTVALTFSGRPIVITELQKNIPAILHLWFPGTEGGNAAANLLFGKANPCGKLSMSFPKSVGQCPIYYNHTSTGRPKSIEEDDMHFAYRSNYIDCGNLPLYSFGHGLSYSDFVYEGLELSADKMSENESIKVNVTIHNNSNFDGKETVMLYMRDLVASNARPVQQLIAFEKVEFKANERKTVEFIVDESMLRFWNNENKFVSEAGVFEISTGYADHLKFTKKFELLK